MAAAAAARAPAPAGRAPLRKALAAMRRRLRQLQRHARLPGDPPSHEEEEEEEEEEEDMPPPSPLLGVDEVTERLESAFLLPLQYAHLFAQTTPTSLLLYGPPGNGKTRMARHLAHALHMPLRVVSAGDVLSAMYGGSERRCRRVFRQAAREGALLFLDEVDCLARVRSATEDEHVRRIKVELLRLLESHRLPLVAATNRPWDIDSAFLRRFHMRIYLPMPSVETRAAILARSLPTLPADDVAQLAKELDGWSAHDCRRLADRAAMLPVLDMIRSLRATPDGRAELDDGTAVARDVTAQDVYSALDDVHASVSAHELETFEAFRTTS